MQANVDVLHLDALPDDVVHLGALCHSGIEHWVQVGVVADSDTCKLLKSLLGHEDCVVVLLNLGRKAPVDRGYLSARSPADTTTIATASTAVGLTTVPSASHKKGND